MPKVIHVLRKFQPHEWGGIETHLVGLLPELRRLGWESEVHAPEETGTDGAALVAAGATFHTFRARYPYLGMGARDRAGLVASSGNLVSTDELGCLLRERHASILHTHTLKRLGGVVRLAARLRGLPYAVTIHGPVLSGGEVVGRAVAARTRSLLDVGAPFGWLVGSRRVVEDADAVFALNRQEHDAWAPARAGRHLALASLGVNPTPASAEARREARAMLPGASGAALVVVVARMEHAKGQDLALAAFARCAPPGAHLVFAGAALTSDFVASLRAQARDAGRPVHFLGNVAPHIARALMAESCVTLVPSRAEPFGLALLEAWAEGAPALFSAVGGLADIGRRVGADLGPVPAPTVDAWTAALSRALANPALLEHEGRLGPARVARDFTWRSTAEQTAVAYASALAAQRAALRPPSRRPTQTVSS
jgi:glycosyltransferase involved in cell wall biosynthesis